MSAEDDVKLNGGRLYKHVRQTVPRLLGRRTCPNCCREFDIKNFKSVKRAGNRVSWLCVDCFAQRESFRRR
jgi:RNase P subunit RPR2